MDKFDILNNVLDSLRKEAPKDFKTYHNSSENGIAKARSLAYIHLFLKVNFNILTFEDRRQYIVDGPQDGGIDAYYIDKDNRIIYLIQSKYRTTASNFEEKSIDANELASMKITSILNGEQSDENGNLYNNKIQTMQKVINNLDNIARYNFEVIILANIKKYKHETIQRLVEKYPYQVYDFAYTYKHLLFPMLKDTSHSPNDITIRLNIGTKNTANLEYSVESNGLTNTVQLFFVPTIEIAKLMSEFKNSILEYNPRSYLGLNKNEINKYIKKSIISSKSNLFSLLNNGITILSDDTSTSTRTGKRGEAQLIVTNPQIINGGQTANTLAAIYEDPEIDNSVFEDKEVLTKIITFEEIEEENEGKNKKLNLIEQLSKATNQQSVVLEADRRSNDKVQVELQNYLFDNFGFCYNRKEGEFLTATQNKYISKDHIIDRDILLRIAYSISGEVSTARRSASKKLFNIDKFEEILNTDMNYNRLFYDYLSYRYLAQLEKNSKKTDDRFFTSKYGNAIKYGKYAVVNLVDYLYKDNINKNELESTAVSNTKKVLNIWKSFEKAQTKLNTNNDYFQVVFEDNEEKFEYNFDGYYKGKTIDNDLEKYREILEQQID